MWRVENGWLTHSKKQTRVCSTKSELIIETSDKKDIKKIETIFKDHILTVEKSGEDSIIFIINKRNLLNIDYKQM